MIGRREFRIEEARRCAREYLHRCGVHAAEHIDVEIFAAHLGVTILSVKLDGADAQLIHVGDRSTILLSDRISSPVIRRFNIAHELGHLLLGHPTRLAEISPRPWMAGSPLEEIEANAFASELLMPTAIVRDLFDLTRADLETPREIASVFDVSILAAAIRFTELTREPCAAVFSVEATPDTGRVKWVANSASMELEIPRNRALSASSLAAPFFATGATTRQPMQVPDSAWFSSSPFGRVIEHVTCAPELRTTLSMVWIRRDGA